MKIYLIVKMQVQAERGCRKMKFQLTYMFPNELKLTVYMQGTSFYIALILDNSIYVVKGILDEPKLWVGDNMWISQCLQFWQLFGDFSNYLSTFSGLLSTLYCLKSDQDTVRHGTSVIEWLFCTLYYHWNRFFYYIWTQN